MTYTVDKNGVWASLVTYTAPVLNIPSLKDLDWKYVDSLPEIQSNYDDSAWIAADHITTNNTLRNITTPTSLYSSDYGFHTGYLVYRGHFVANGNESTFYVLTQGGSAFGSSVWLNQTYIGSWSGIDAAENNNNEYKLPKLTAGESYVFTVLIDNMGIDENWVVGQEGAKNPRGILGYTLAGQDPKAITWKLTGNLDGEDYQDHTRGPLNEGGLYAERQGWHQPYPPSRGWNAGKPMDGISAPGVSFFTTSFDLDIPSGWDVPLYFTFGNSTTPPPAYRVQLYVNGYQFGKYINNIGPQTSFPVPQGILNYHGTNWLAVSLWAQQVGGAKLDSFVLYNTTPLITALRVENVEMPEYSKRNNAY